jgi:hypothetical protein
MQLSPVPDLPVAGVGAGASGQGTAGPGSPRGGTPTRRSPKGREVSAQGSTARAAKAETPAGESDQAAELRRLDDAEGSFAPGVATKLQTYVYLLIDPRTGRPFFVGRGRGDRCFRHVREARSNSGAKAGDKYPMLDRIRAIEEQGRTVRIDVLRYGLSREEALMVEASVSDALGLGPTELGGQRRPAVEVSSRLAKRVKFKRAHQVVICRVGPIGVDPDYQTARHGWRIGQRWTDPTSVRSPKWAVLVVGDLVTGVHRIEGWVPSDGRGPGRHSFTGPPDKELEKRYVGKSVAPYLGTASQSPVTYVWCGPHWVNTPR